MRILGISSAGHVLAIGDGIAAVVWCTDSCSSAFFVYTLSKLVCM